MRQKKKSVLSLLLAALLLCLTALPASAASATASTMQLTKTEGTVGVTNASGKSLGTWANMLLYSGYHVATQASSYAWINLDSSKLTKLDQSSKVEVRKSGTVLELLINSGNLYFNVTSPLAANETFNIHTSTMVVGVRGTSGWIKELDNWTTEVYILEGTVQCVTADPATGETRTATVSAGEKVIVSVDPGKREGERCEIIHEKFDRETDIDDFVREELDAEPDGEESGPAGENITWAYRNGVLSFEGTGEMLGFMNDTDNPWHHLWSKVHTVVVGEGVTNISGGAFRGFDYLTSVTLPDSLTSIGFVAFKNCISLTSIKIPESVTSLGDNLFEGCTSLTDINIPAGVTKIGGYTFSGCTSLTSLTFPDGIDMIYAYTFYNCRSLTSVRIPAGVTRIANSAFQSCGSLSDVYYGGSEDQWEQIEINSNGNTVLKLKRTTIHYNS